MSRRLDKTSLEWLARGSALLGSGGGGDSEIGLLASLQAVEEYGPPELVTLEELPGDSLIMPCGMIGAPTVHLEKYVNGNEGARLRDRLQDLVGAPVGALMCAEVGGSNGLLPVAWAAQTGLPLLDADGMGRAFPRIPQLTMELARIPPCPSVLTDERGNEIVFHVEDGDWLERLVRAAVVELGGAACGTEYSMTAGEARDATVIGSISRAIEIGRSLATSDRDPVQSLLAHLSAVQLVRGKLVDIDRRTTGGFAVGSFTVEGLDGDTGRVVEVQFQNENLVVSEGGEVLASVPDIISVVENDRAESVVTERLRYGQRVTVVAFACDPAWRTPEGLALAGPRAFGYPVDYRPVEDLHDATR